MTGPSLLIVIVNWNAGEHIANCVQSFLCATKPGPTHMLVVDNASQDGSERVIEAIAAERQDVSLVRAGTNLGFGNACNFGVQYAREVGLEPDYILFLNPDTLLDIDTFDRLFRAGCLRNPDIGIFGVQLLNGSSIATSCSYFPTALNFWCKYTGLNLLFSGLASAHHHMRDFDHSKSREVDQVMGAFLMIRRQLFDRLNGFDSQFFVYFEEVDLCLRAQQAGYKVWFEASSQVWHHGGGTTESVKGFRHYLSLSSRLRYFAKNCSRSSYISVLILSFVAEPIARALRSTLRGRFGDLKELGKSYGLILRNGIK